MNTRIDFLTPNSGKTADTSIGHGAQQKIHEILRATPNSSKKATISSLSVGKQFYVIFTTRTKKYKKLTPSAEYLKKNLSIDTIFDPP